MPLNEITFAHDIDSKKQHLFSEHICNQRMYYQPCHVVTDRLTCLTSFDSRWDADNVKFGTKCVWCHGGSCTDNQNFQCAPQSWLLKVNPLKKADECDTSSLDYDKGIIYHSKLNMLLEKSRY